MWNGPSRIAAPYEPNKQRMRGIRKFLWAQRGSIRGSILGLDRRCRSRKAAVPCPTRTSRRWMTVLPAEHRSMVNCAAGRSMGPPRAVEGDARSGRAGIAKGAVEGECASRAYRCAWECAPERSRSRTRRVRRRTASDHRSRAWVTPEGESRRRRVRPLSRLACTSTGDPAPRSCHRATIRHGSRSCARQRRSRR